MGYNLLINGVYWGYTPLTNHLLTSWDIQAVAGFSKGRPRISDPTVQSVIDLHLLIHPPKLRAKAPESHDGWKSTVLKKDAPFSGVNC